MRTDRKKTMNIRRFIVSIWEKKPRFQTKTLVFEKYFYAILNWNIPRLKSAVLNFLFCVKNHRLKPMA